MSTSSKVRASRRLDLITHALSLSRSVVRRLAYNYEHGNSLENRIAVVLNQGVRACVYSTLLASSCVRAWSKSHPACSQPRLFRDALSRSIEEQVDELLENFVTQLCSCSNGSSDPKPPFILFYFSDLMLYKKLREHTETQSDDGCASGFSSAPTTTTPASTGPLGALGFRSPLALGSPLSTVNPRNASMTNADSGANATPTRLEPTQTQSSLSFRSMYTSTRSLFPSPAGRATPSDSTRQQQRGNRNKPKKKKNAVMNHAEPQVFQRVVQFAGANSQTAQQCPESDSGCVVGVGSADAIAYVVVPFVKEVVPLFFAGVPKSKRVHRAELKHIRWENFPLEAIMRGRNPTALSTSPKKGSAMTNMTAWKQGNCLIIYPEHTGSTTTSSSDNTSSTIEFESEKAAITAMSSESTRLRHLREEKLAVVALFDALEPLAQALMIGRT